MKNVAGVEKSVKQWGKSPCEPQVGSIKVHDMSGVFDEVLIVFLITYFVE